MLKLKRIIALITVAMFVFSFAAPAVAADTTTAAVSKTAIGADVKGTKYEDATKKLISLGIINGFEDGTVRPESTVTRAQFAAIVAQELGIADGVGQSTTKFKDVPASHWASGVINLAVGRGIIVGYPDGSFKPEAPVTYAEAYAMLVQMLGYGPTIKGAAWPSGVLAKAASLGVSKGVSGAASTAMKRGDVILAAENSLTIDIMEQDEWGTDNIYKKQDDKTILSEIFNITVYDGTNTDGEDGIEAYKTVSSVPKTDLSGLKANEIKFTGDGTKYSVSAVYNPNDFIGQEVETWVDDDDDVVYYIGGSDNETVIYDSIDATYDGDGSIYLKDVDDDYAILDDDDADVNGTKIWYNLDKSLTFDSSKADSSSDSYVNDNELEALAIEGASIKVVLNDDDKIVAAVITDYTASDAISGLAKEVSEEDETVKYYNDNGGTSTLDLDDADYAIVKDGVPAEISDIEAFDVVNVLDSGDDEYFITVTSTQVKGTADVSWSSDSAVEKLDITVGDTKYDVSPDVTYSDDANDSIDAASVDDIKDLNGEDVTLYIDAAGDVRHIVSGEVNGQSGKLIGVVSKSATYSGSYDDEVKFKLVNKAGSELTFEFDPDDVDLYDADGIIDWTDGNDFASYLDLTADPLIVVEYKLDSAGELSKITLKDGEYTDILNDIKVNDDDKTISVDGGDYAITDDTIIFDVTQYDENNDGEYDDVKTVTWDALKNKDDVEGAVVTDDDEVDYLIVTHVDGSLSSEGNYAVVTGFTTVGGDDAVKLLLADGTKQTIVDDSTVTSEVYGHSAKLAKGDFIRYELDSDNELDEVQILAAPGKYSELSGSNAALDIENLVNAVVLDSTSSSLKVNVKGSASDTSARFTINGETKIFEIYDTDKLRQVTSVKEGSVVVIIDTDDDNKSANFVVVVNDKTPSDW